MNKEYVQAFEKTETKPSDVEIQVRERDQTLQQIKCQIIFPHYVPNICNIIIHVLVCSWNYEIVQQYRQSDSMLHLWVCTAAKLNSNAFCKMTFSKM